jgi:hypothetical protein
MKNIGTVYGNEEQAKPVIVGEDVIYVHNNIEKIETISPMGTISEVYRYDESQYTKDEFMGLLFEKIIELNMRLLDFSKQIEEKE